jgi:hypothetical protein
VRFSINRELAVAVQNSRRVLVASAEKLFQSLSSHPIRERYYVSVILPRRENEFCLFREHDHAQTKDEITISELFGFLF